jgi:hypothetical protein
VLGREHGLDLLAAARRRDVGPHPPAEDGQSRVVAGPLRMNLGGGTPEGVAHLWGFCRTCEFAPLCRGGDTFTAHTFFNRRGNHPYCHHRALVQRSHGVRERLVLEQAATGDPYDNGVFSIVEEPVDDPWPEGDELRFTADKVVWPPGWPVGDSNGDSNGDGDGDGDGEGEARRPAPARGSPALVSHVQRPPALLPRSGWASEFARLREIVRAKAALDRAEAAWQDEGAGLRD